MEVNGYLLDANALFPLLRPGNAAGARVLARLRAVPGDSPVCIASATIAEAEVGCCLQSGERSEAQAEIRDVVHANNLRVLDFTTHTAAEYGALKAAMMLRYNRLALKSRNRAKWPERWPRPDTGADLGIDEFDLIVVSHALSLSITGRGWARAQALSSELVQSSTSRPGAASPSPSRIRAMSSFVTNTRFRSSTAPARRASLPLHSRASTEDHG